MAEPSVVVMGGGLAGIAAAVRLAAQGRRVTLVETSRRLGGRATSHEDPKTGQTVDNCQHVVMGCCTNLLDLYDRLGVGQSIDWHSRLHFFDKQGHHDLLQPGEFLPAPFHLSTSMLMFGTLTLREKLAIAMAMLAMLRMGVRGREAVGDMTFEQWLRKQNQPQTAIDRFWAVIIISALNQTPEKSAAAAAIHVFQDGFLAHEHAYLMGTASIPLRLLYDPAVQVIEAAGGRVIFGGSVKRIAFDHNQVVGVELADGTILEGEAYISALPFDRLDKVIDEPLRKADTRLASLDRFEHSPILGIHLWYDRPVIEWPHMIFVDSPLQWIFNKSEGQTGEQYLHGVISAADDWVDQSQAEILAMTEAELLRYEPNVKNARLVRGRVIKEKRATFSPTPHIEPHRPNVQGSVTNLYLAGDWTNTGWPATMEGAARSGYVAAAAAMNQPLESLLVDDLPTRRLARMIAKS